MPNPHILIHRVYPPRALGFSLAVVLTLLSLGSELLVQPLAASLLLVCLVYPHAAYLLQRVRRSSAQAVRWLMLVDAVLASLLMMANHYYLLSIVAFLSFVVLSTAIIAGLRAALSIFIAVIAMVLFGFLVFHDPDRDWFYKTNTLIEMSYLIAIVAYPTFVAWHVYKVTQELAFSKKQSEQHYQALQTTTEHLRRYLSPQLFSALVAKPEAGAAKRKRLTLCFTDLAGFTEVMDRLPEHEITQLLNEYLNAMATIAIEHGGTVDKFMGDGLMVFFGDPHTKGPKGDAISCIRMAQQMRIKLANLSQEWNERGLDNGLIMRIGIHTGYCAVGNFGSDSRMDYTAIGSSVNIASRIEAAANNGEILLSAATMRLVFEEVQTKSPVTLQLKGIQQPVMCSAFECFRSQFPRSSVREARKGFRLEYDLKLISSSEVRALLLNQAELLGAKEEETVCADSSLQLLR